jgi:hypothetical protein
MLIYEVLKEGLGNAGFEQVVSRSGTEVDR